MKYAIKGLLLCVLLSGICWARKKPDKHPERTARDEFAYKLAKAIEIDGWTGFYMYAARPGGCIGLAFGGIPFDKGNRDCLCVVNGAVDPDGIKRFADEINPHLGEMKSLGFIEIDFAGLQQGYNYPNGYARFPITDGSK